MATVPTLNSLAARVATLEADLAALKAQMVKGDELRQRLTALEDFVKVTREGLRAIFTVFHPIADHEPGQKLTAERAVVSAGAVHALLMEWIEKLGGRVPLPGSEEGSA